MVRYKQLAVGVAANLGNIASGMALGYSAVALPAMQSPHHTPPVSDEEASWIASMVSFGMPAGCLLMSPMLDRLGRRRTLMLVNVPSLLGWLLIATASHTHPWILYQVYAGRLLAGVAAGLVGLPAVVYAGEVLDKTWRNIVVTFTSLGTSIGIVIVYVLGSLFQDNWRLVAGICCSFPVISIVAVWYMVPESPVWLLSRGWVQEAEASMRRIRGVPREDSLPDDMQQELSAMMHSSTRLDNKNSWKDRLIFLKRPEAYKPLLITNALFFFQQFSGIHVVIMYTVTIVQKTGVQVDDYLITVLIGISRLIMSFVVSFASTRYGRRLLFLVSGVGMALFLGLLAGFLSLTHNEIIGPETAITFGWVPITALLLSVMFATVGFLTLPFAMLGEVFPAKIRGWAGAVSTLIATIFFFLAIKLFFQMNNWIGFHNVCITYAAVIVIGTVFTYFYVPETHGKTLKEIENFFKGGDDIVTVGGQPAEKLLPVSENCELLRRDENAAGGDSAAGKVMLGPRTIQETKHLGTKLVDGLT